MRWKWTWLAKSATEWTTSANITWLEEANHTPNLSEKTRKLHHKAVLTARWLQYIEEKNQGQGNGKDCVAEALNEK